MEPIYQKSYTISSTAVDRYSRLKPTEVLCYAQEVAVEHCNRLHVSVVSSEQQELFWAIIRHRVQITRLPMEGETIRVETWPMPTTRSAYPRSTVAYDEQGEEIFRTLGLWVLMDRQSRSMVLPGKSGVDLQGLLRGNELTVPGSLVPKMLEHHMSHIARYSELDCNGHVNNTKYMDWICDLLPSAFHKEHPVKEFTICYHTEALEGQELDLNWELQDGPTLRVDSHRTSAADPTKAERVFSAQVLFE